MNELSGVTVSTADSLGARRTLREIAAIGWLVLIAAAFLAPALAHGTSIGPYDLLSRFGLTSNPNLSVHNLVGSDEIQEFIPWEALAWMQVHGGHLPLWDPYSMLGLPLAFNVQSDPFSLSVAIGYLFPLSLAHTAAVASRLIIAGSGAYVFARVMRLDLMPALFFATIFELSGAFTVWLGAYEADAMAWSGWVFASSVLILRGKHRVGAVCFLAVTVAFALLAGEPQIAAVQLGMLGAFAIIMIVYRWRSGARRVALSAGLDHVLGIIAGVCLAAPIYLPGIQLGLSSARNAGPPISGLPLYDLTHLLFSDYNGVPTSLSTVIGPNNLYVSMLYVGVIALVLATVALAYWRERREVVALTIITAGLLVALFVSPLITLFRHVPYLDIFRLQLATTGVDFCLAALAGFGVQALLSRRGERWVEFWLQTATILIASAILALGLLLVVNMSRLSGPQQRLRTQSFVWPVVELSACAVLLLGHRPFSLCSRLRLHSPHGVPLRQYWARRGLWGLLVLENAFLLTAGAGFLSSDQGYLPEPSAVTALQRIVGTSLVGFGSCDESGFPTAGIVTNANLAYGVAEFAAYDPILPRAYYLSYGQATGGETRVLLPVGLFCPSIDSVRVARLYGVSYVIEPPDVPGPSGTRRVAVLHGEGLYAIPDSGRATLTSSPASRPPIVEPVREPNPTTWNIAITARHSSILELRISNVPGWQAEIDGRPLHLISFDHVMLEAIVPKGRYIVTLHYWPKAFTFGLGAAGTAIIALAAAITVDLLRKRRMRGHQQLVRQAGPQGALRGGIIGS